VKRRDQVLEIWLKMNQASVQLIRHVASGISSSISSSSISSSSSSSSIVQPHTNDYLANFVSTVDDRNDDYATIIGGDESSSSSSSSSGSSTSSTGVSISIVSPSHGSTIQGHDVVLTVKTSFDTTGVPSVDFSRVSLNVQLNGKVVATHIKETYFSTPIEGLHNHTHTSSPILHHVKGLMYGQHAVEVFASYGTASS
jgi:hypothetical protein